MSIKSSPPESFELIESIYAFISSSSGCVFTYSTSSLYLPTATSPYEPESNAANSDCTREFIDVFLSLSIMSAYEEYIELALELTEDFSDELMRFLYLAEYPFAISSALLYRPDIIASVSSIIFPSESYIYSFCDVFMYAVILLFASSIRSLALSSSSFDTMSDMLDNVFIPKFMKFDIARELFSAAFAAIFEFIASSFSL